MKKNKTMRVAGMLLALTLITSCFVGGTFAKYTTGADANDAARVAKFGVEVTTGGELFGKTYSDAKNGNTIATSGTYTVSSNDKVVAPGTKGSVQNFLTVSGTPEVAVHVEATLTADHMICLPQTGASKPYADFVTEADDTFTLAENYYPIRWTLNDGTKDLVTGTLTDVKAYLDAHVTGDYYPGTPESGKTMTDFANDVAKNFTLSWEWAFGQNDQADTYLGNMAAGLTATTGAPTAELNEAFTFTIAVTQID